MMKEFWNDYTELCAETFKFYGKHWKGCIVMNLALAGIMIAGSVGKELIRIKLEEM